MNLNEITLKVKDWFDFSDKVVGHIDNYVVPQYGDKGEDLATNYTVNDCKLQMQRYLNRQGRNSRPDQDKLDLIKIAHYAQLAHTLLEEQENAKSK